MTEFSNSLRKQIEDIGLTKAVLARHIGVTADTLNRYMSGESSPSVDTLIKLQKLGFDFREIVLPEVVYRVLTCNVVGSSATWMTDREVKIVSVLIDFLKVDLREVKKIIQHINKNLSEKINEER